MFNYLIIIFFQHRDKHQEQVAQLRDEITEKATLMEELKDDNQKMTLAFEFIVIKSQLLEGQSHFLVAVLQHLHQSGLLRDFILQLGIGPDYSHL